MRFSWGDKEGPCVLLVVSWGDKGLVFCWWCHGGGHWAGAEVFDILHVVFCSHGVVSKIPHRDVVAAFVCVKLSFPCLFVHCACV